MAEFPIFLIKNAIHGLQFNSIRSVIHSSDLSDLRLL